MKIEDFQKKYEPSGELMYAGLAALQMRVPQQYFHIFGDYTPDLECDVVSYHMSKSVILPVFRWRSRERKTTLWMRANFHNFACSLVTPYDTPLYTESWNGTQVDPVYFEGFCRPERSVEMGEEIAPVFTTEEDERYPEFFCASFHLSSPETFMLLFCQLFMGRAR